MNLAILTKRFNGLKVDTEYGYVHDKFPNGKEIVDVYKGNQWLSAIAPKEFEEHFMKIMIW